MFYTGYNSTSFYLPFGYASREGAEISNLYEYNNRPKHSVTFLGKVTGDFVVQPGLMTRHHDFSWINDDVNYNVLDIVQLANCILAQNCAG